MRRDLIRAIAIGVIATLSLAWLAPPLLIAFWPSSLQYRWSDVRDGYVLGADRISVGRNWLIDWWQYLPFTLRPGPDAALPSAVARVRDDAEARRWDRIDTGLTGYPFRAFASEAWYPAGSNGAGMPEFRGNFHIGRIAQREVLMPFIPIWLGLLGDVVGWALVAHVAWAIPRTVRRIARRRRGACIRCGHDRRGSEYCSECGHR